MQPVEQATASTAGAGKRWYVSAGGAEPVGPVTLDQLVRGTQAGKIPFDAIVCPEGGSTWTPISDVRELRAAFPRARDVPTPQGSGIPPPSSSSTSSRHPQRLLVIGAAIAGAALLLGSCGALGLCVVCKSTSAEQVRDPCKVTTGCQKHGECTQIRPPGRDSPLCKAASKADCSKSTYCIQYGMCSFVPYDDFPSAGTCEVVTDADCEQSIGCAEAGRCKPNSGSACLSGTPDPVRNLYLGGNHPCCR